jgi:SAM-dependent methyltransferase
VPGAGVSERDYHDHHYEHEAAILRSPIFGRVHERGARDFLRATGCGRAHRILSLGCGDGSIELRLAPYVGEIVGTDISSVAIAQAKARAEAAGLRNVSFFTSDKIDPGHFDAVVAFAFLHHLDDAAIRATLAGARKALRRGGVFYSADPSRRRLIGLFTGLVRRTYERYHSPDERELDPEALAGLAKDAGFSNVRIGYADYFLGPLAWLAPRTPSWLGGPLEALDNAALRLPLLGRYASSFSLLAHAAP